MPKIELLKGTLDMLILRTLTGGSMHGYAVALRIRKVTEDTLQIEEGPKASPARSTRVISGAGGAPPQPAIRAAATTTRPGRRFHLLVIGEPRPRASF